MIKLNVFGTKLSLLVCAACAIAVLAACSPAPQAPAAATPAAAPVATPAAPAEASAETATPPAAPEPAPAPAAPKKTTHKAYPEKSPAAYSGSIAGATPAPARTPLKVCSNCGVIIAITPIKEEGKGTAIGVLAGGLAGLAVGNQIGDGNGKTIAKIAGAAGGALLGNKIEKKIRAVTHYEIKVRYDDGTETTVTQDSEPTLAVGAAVQVVDGTVVAK